MKSQAPTAQPGPPGADDKDHPDLGSQPRLHQLSSPSWCAGKGFPPTACTCPGCRQGAHLGEEPGMGLRTG